MTEKKQNGRAPNAAFMKPMNVSATLAKIIGDNKPLPRTEVTKKVWDYIKKNNRQNPENKRNILATGDADLQALFDGRGEVTMFEMTKLISAHLTPA